MKKKMTAVLCGAVLGATLMGTTAYADQTYRVTSGDTLWGISMKHGATVSDLKSWNNLNTDLIFIGQKLIVGKDKQTAPAPAAPKKEEKTKSPTPTPTPTTSTTYTVSYGDTLWRIATSHNVSVTDIKTWNGLSSSVIFPGQRLKVSAPESSVPQPDPEPAAPEQPKEKPKEEPKDNSNEAKAMTGAALIEEGMKHIGSPYQWAGTSPAGFDCSGFLHYVFAQFDKTIPRSVATIHAYPSFKIVEETERKPGDIVFFETYRPGPSHAGIYLGDDRFIHSGSSSGVTISDMNSRYWHDRYLGSKRYID
ncbi:LysM peptidoglycan-binding domain-containing protein [Halobacillus yeomjeoni]|uniref:LysM peptidoglycan-binding domain-containing protein n=1 Tax=Halobacillus yeomjeoni TaxID=311194 RepID=A0A931HWD6_9BACI|nr:LysM peptidoglycan-binding domain-containing protein [Halobacillus yeomjeoni]MBH0231107.1 LysM peptidoglycan-binding domain-containing protein [Halobacillus yeomjeoni]MCA0984020.1 LysM peptidoglycan-binding domain-containing protein [Halobacillus yeomjeoni]